MLLRMMSLATISALLAVPLELSSYVYDGKGPGMKLLGTVELFVDGQPSKGRLFACKGGASQAEAELKRVCASEGYSFAGKEPQFFRFEKTGGLRRALVIPGENVSSVVLFDKDCKAGRDKKEDGRPPGGIPHPAGSKSLLEMKRESRGGRAFISISGSDSGRSSRSRFFEECFSRDGWGLIWDRESQDGTTLIVAARGKEWACVSVTEDMNVVCYYPEGDPSK